MGHYDNCRSDEGYCAGCGAAPGNMVFGLCEFCDKDAIRRLREDLLKNQTPKPPKPRIKAKSCS